MKMYNNGQRSAKMYGGGQVLRKPMMMGGLAQQNRKMTTGMAGMENPMGRMTEKKRYDMGMKTGGLVGGQKKLDKNKDGKISGKDFAMMRKS